MLGGKPSTRLHEVFNLTTKCIDFVGSKSACNAWGVNQPAQARQNLEVRVAKR